jgi:NAD(P)-dependent dehydrogenase (short-subunit alcohol dehydrogenase family)
MSSTANDKYTLADQVARFARAKKENNQRYLNIESVYDPSYLKGLRVAVTGANRGIGLALATELTQAGAQVVALVRSTSKELQDLKPAEVIEGVDVQNDVSTAQLGSQVKGGPIDILINNAGYFREEMETLDSLDFADQLKTIDICACGPLRVTAALINAGLMKEGSKVIMITSQGGSVSWRTVQNPQGGDYGHHVRKRVVGCFLCRDMWAGFVVGWRW